MRNIKLFSGPELGLPRALRNMYQTDEHEVLDFNETLPNPPSLGSGHNGFADAILERVC